MVKAVINGDRIECGKCGALLLKVVESSQYVEEGNLILEIKCTHKDKGKKCGEINTIEL
jgi:phage FluMu protein Com